ncbi:cobalt-precorrin-5B (C(1))-methyltransferase CbiD [Halosquirtibacter xylanolyticus]|uniref:cobalt-precorrin-5B (C(1))-methyltransferase CbiD n=1 Tax=Halosquirtibacter xylanolyticus TaxID=3374599 RepID=UPI00374876B2|nr:cobalt-precorrin-5B (C(1))-methyltransferase CbiD [Prolixibacteraceae bacterium]
MKNKLRSGYSTGTCVTLAVKACLIQLFDNKEPSSVGVFIPTGEFVEYEVYNLYKDENLAKASVTKDGGDDPDDTHGLEIGCSVTLIEKKEIVFKRGVGIGLVTLPGLSLDVGEPAINPTPREMITKLLYKEAFKNRYEGGFIVEPFVPEGEEVAKKTFNPRVGIVGGISIIGTTGVVKPYSSDAFVASIEQGIRVLQENGGIHAILNSGGRSEKYVQKRFPDYSSLSYVQYGNFIGESLKIIAHSRIEKVTICIMLGKAVKLAQGHLDTHSHKVQFSPEWLSSLAEACGYDKRVQSEIQSISLAGQLPSIIPMNASSVFYQQIIRECYGVCKPLLNGQELDVILVSKEGMLIECEIPYDY